jgi:hypothetical protein
VIRENVNSRAGIYVHHLGLVDFYDCEPGGGDKISAFVMRGKDVEIGAFKSVRADAFPTDNGHGEDDIFYSVFT